MTIENVTKLAVRAALVAALAVGMACGTTPSGKDSGTGGGSGGGATGGGSGGGATGGGSGGGATGGGSGGGATGGGSGGGATGGGSGGGTGVCTAQPVAITFDAGCGNALPAPGACGGDPSGTWCVTSYCVDPSPALNAIKSVCTTATFEKLEGTVQGSAAFVGTEAQGTVLRTTQLNLEVIINVPSACTYGGYVTCAQVESAMKYGGYDAGCYDNDAGGCFCNAGQYVNDTSSGVYTAANGHLDAGGGGYDYCVQGSTFRYEKTDPPKSEPGVATMTK